MPALANLEQSGVSNPLFNRPPIDSRKKSHPGATEEASLTSLQL